ncbi:MAG: glucose-6-phosphate isomerase [Firmicutes bacterium]|nr:glucose-6-phosphate isomerase [Bacillota bacterium]
MKIDITSAGLRDLDLTKAKEAARALKAKTGRGSEFTGWTTLPFDYDKAEYRRLRDCAARIRKEADALIVIGIGGSYLGARAAIELLKSPRHNAGNRPQIYFAGNGISPEDLSQIIRLTEGKKVFLNVISKSGTTLEPALAFRILRQRLEKALGKAEAARRIICTTDRAKGALKGMADREGYECFVIPDDIGGRYSVLTPVGLLPMEAAGIDTEKILEGAAEGMSLFLSEDESNPALTYAAARQALQDDGKLIEVLSYPGENMRFFAEWWKQLYGESEGKELGGIFPASLELTADLHSLGQYMQQGRRILTETIIRFDRPADDMALPFDEENADGLNYAAGKTFSEIFEAAARGVRQAHEEGGVPVTELVFESPDERTLGEMFAFFEASCGISGYIQGVDPFDQPGVEAYKKNMFRLLGK